MSETMAAPRTIAALLGAALVLTCQTGGGALAMDRTRVGRAEVVLEQPDGGPFVGEMVLLKFRAVVQGLTALDELRQPSLVDLDWKQLGRDRTFDADFGGRVARGYERVMAIYPQRSGEITIESFDYHLTMIDDDNARFEVDLTSDPVRLEVRPAPPGPAETFSLPARSLTISEQWDKSPDRLAAGETALRTVVIEARGVGAERLPPPPPMRAPGVISFARATERSTTITPEGPAARATYRWDVKPASALPAMLPAVPVHWFDTDARQPRTAEIPARRIGLAGSTLDGKAEEARPTPWRLRDAGIACLAAFVWGLAALRLCRTVRERRRRFSPASLKALRRAARAGDARAFRGALSALVRSLPQSGPQESGPQAADVWSSDPELRDGLAALDAHLFGSGRHPPPSLPALCRRITRIVRTNDTCPADIVGRLAPLDGAAAYSASHP